jgi:hypothetical protein
MVRSHDDKYNHEAIRRRSVNTSRISVLSAGNPRRNASILTEWQVRLYPRHIGLVYERRFAKPAFALCVFRRQQMASRRPGPQNLATRGDLEALRY